MGEFVNMEKKHTITFLKPAMLLAMFALCFIACIAIRPSAANAASKKVKITLEFTDGTKKIWKTGNKKISLGKKKLAYVYFGSYPQTEVTGDALTSKITDAKYNKDGVATVDGVKYKRISKEDATYTISSSGQYDWTDKTYAYFKYEPIKWRVLSNKSGKVLLLSEYGLDAQKYYSKWVSITWSECTLRSWLNKTFYSTAFSSTEKKFVKTVKLKNENNHSHGTEGSPDTKDKVYLLSFEDMMNTKYGFNEVFYEDDLTRRCAASDFAKAMGTWTNTFDYETADGLVSSQYWLRSPGDYFEYASFVGCDGRVNNDLYLTCNDTAVRPAMQLNLSSVIK